MTDLKNINETIMSLNESDLIHVILCGNKNFENSMNISILTATIKFIKDSVRFDQLLFLTITKTILIPSSIPFLNFFLDFCINVLYFSPYCLHMISKVSFLYCLF